MHPRRPLSWTFFLLSALAAIGLFFVPALIIRPFTRQSTSGLALAMALRQRAPIGTLIAATVCVIFAFLLWQSDNRRRKIALCSILFLVVLSTVIARLN